MCVWLLPVSLCRLSLRSVSGAISPKLPQGALLFSEHIAKVTDLTMSIRLY